MQSIKFFIGFKFDLGPFFSLEVSHLSTKHLSLFTGKQSAIFFLFVREPNSGEKKKNHKLMRPFLCTRIVNLITSWIPLTVSLGIRNLCL